MLTIEPGVDDSTPSEFLTYDVDLRVDGHLPVEAGRSLVAARSGDGHAVVRLETASFGRLLSESMEITVQAVDLGGNRARSTFRHAPDAAGAAGCSAHGVVDGQAPSSLALALLPFAAILRRCTRRRRSA